MKLYLNGQIISIGKTYILFENNDVGNIIYVPNPTDFKPKTKIKLFVYEYTNEYQNNLYGFSTFNERILFEDLISVTGVGPKTALAALQMGYEKLAQFIAGKDVVSISNLRYMGEKTANQICFELAGKYQKLFGLKDGESLPSEISTTLKTLGFKKSQIDYAINKISPSDNIEKMIEEAIILISNEKQPSTKQI